MLLKKRNNRYFTKSQLLIVGSLLIIISLGIFTFRTIIDEYQKSKEKNMLENFYKTQEIKEETTTEKKSQSQNKKSEEEKYIASIKIPKINLEKGLVSKDNKNNNVKKNIQILKDSDSPEKENGNVILAAHSGTSKVAFFRDLYKLTIEDEVIITYNKKIYKYKVTNIYDIDKTGKAQIIRNHGKNTLTLITCRQKTKKQIIIICELIERNDFNEGI